MARGGYIIVDVGGIQLTNASATTVKGIYARLGSNYGKPVLIHNVKDENGAELADYYVTVRTDNSNFYLEAGTRTLIITPNDMIHYGELPAEIAMKVRKAK